MKGSDAMEKVQVKEARAERGRSQSAYPRAPRDTPTPVLPLALAGRAPRKARGLLFTRPDEGAMLFMPCCDVHTVGMRHRLDVAFIDASGLVVDAYRDVGPFRRLRGKGAVAVVERFSSCASPWFSLGDRLGVVRVEGGRL